MLATERLQIFCAIKSFSNNQLLRNYFKNSERFTHTEKIVQAGNIDIAIFPDFETMNKAAPKLSNTTIFVCANAQVGKEWNNEGATLSYFHCDVPSLHSTLLLIEALILKRKTAQI